MWQLVRSAAWLYLVWALEDLKLSASRQGQTEWRDGIN